MNDDPYEQDPEQPVPPDGVIVEDVLVDAAQYLDGLDEIDRKYPEGFFDDAAA
jgi:hypothetical protein